MSLAIPRGHCRMRGSNQKPGILLPGTTSDLNCKAKQTRLLIHPCSLDLFGIVYSDMQLEMLWSLVRSSGWTPSGPGKTWANEKGRHEFVEEQAKMKPSKSVRVVRVSIFSKETKLASNCCLKCLRKHAVSPGTNHQPSSSLPKLSGMSHISTISALRSEARFNRTALAYNRTEIRRLAITSPQDFWTPNHRQVLWLKDSNRRTLSLLMRSCSRHRGRSPLAKELRKWRISGSQHVPTIKHMNRSSTFSSLHGMWTKEIITFRTGRKYVRAGRRRQSY